MSVSLSLVIYLAVKPIFKIYFIIAIGFFLARKNILTVTTCRDISDSVVTAIMPCLIFDNVVTNLKSSDIKNLGIIFFEGVLLFGTGAVLAVAIAFLTRSPKRWLGGLISVGLFGNISDLPIAYLQTFSHNLPVFTADEGNKGVAYVIIFLASQVFFQFSMGLYQLVEWDFRADLAPETESSKDSAKTASDAEKTPESPPRFVIVKLAAPTPPHSASSDDVSMSSIDLEREPAREALPVALPAPEHVVSHHSSAHSGLSSNSSSLDPRTRRRKSSVGTTYHLLNPVVSRTTELRMLRLQDVNDVILEYSEFEHLRNNEAVRSVTGTLEVGVLEPSKDQPQNRFKRHLYRILKNFASPNSATLVVSIAIAMLPPLKSLFVPAKFKIPNAPDGQPPLSFVMDLTSYVGAASVPLGLLLLGATISRLRIRTMPPGFWKTALAVPLMRLVILPIVGVGLTTGLQKAGWFADDRMIRFVSVLSFGVPSATSLVYFTAFYTDPLSDDHIQMDCLAVCLIAQYLVLWITLPFLMTFTLKVSMGA